MVRAAEKRNYLEVTPQKGCSLTLLSASHDKIPHDRACASPSCRESFGQTLHLPGHHHPLATGTDVASLVPVLGGYLSQPAGSGLPPGPSVCWGPPGPGARLVRW